MAQKHQPTTPNFNKESRESNPEPKSQTSWENDDKGTKY